MVRMVEAGPERGYVVDGRWVGRADYLSLMEQRREHSARNNAAARELMDTEIARLLGLIE